MLEKIQCRCGLGLQPQFSALQECALCSVVKYIVLYSAVRCSEVRCNAVRCSEVRCSAVRCSAVQCTEARCSAVWRSEVSCSAVRCSEVRCSAVWHSEVRCSAVRCSEMLCSAVCPVQFIKRDPNLDSNICLSYKPHKTNICCRVNQVILLDRPIL